MKITQASLFTKRLILEPIDETHAQELCDLFHDPELHCFIPVDPPTLEVQSARCKRWAKRVSPDGKEIWLNWIGRDKTTGIAVGHFQAGIKSNHEASIAYYLSKPFHKKGLATEGLESVIFYLKNEFHIQEVKAWIDTRNEASIKVAQRLGMKQIDFIKNADFFKGASSDEYVFSLIF